MKNGYLYLKENNTAESINERQRQCIDMEGSMPLHICGIKLALPGTTPNMSSTGLNQMFFLSILRKTQVKIWM
jgi:hypothetical protein